MKLNKRDSKMYKEITHAVCTICNSASIILHDIDNANDRVVWSYSFENICRSSKIQCNKEGELVFRIGNTYYNFNEFCIVH